ncbi:hypothetical protein HB364_18015 [Pseudoflavitalea sp. X16]|uniref:DUF6934 family protein n=1 Tax=Paraflavitalea devenefica TaxID=2716334 RepID=UPI0014249CC7|nr:hypothetical protein [Paraflavitalea devenefica]NII26992.1 hypothetical protein [Paraflavitalea devenefica]
MNYERYTELEISSDALEYKFISRGPKGDIPKIIQFKATYIPNMYNLAFGDLSHDGSIDDLVVNNNKDRNKILATVTSAVYEFTSKFPENGVFFTGSTPERTRLYRMAIALNYGELVADFEIFGIIRDMNTFLDVPFEKGVDYFGFLIKRKNAKFEK